MSGDCWQLANALADLLDTDIVCYGRLEVIDGITTGTCHAAVRHDGRVLDAEGLHDEADVIRQWGPPLDTTVCFEAFGWVEGRADNDTWDLADEIVAQIN